MELKINEIAIPERIVFNYEELKTELAESVKMYETIVYTDSDIKQAKTDKANLNKLKKALNDERIKREREYMAPFNEFKAQINEIIGIIDKPIHLIDTRVKEYENKKIAEKDRAIQEYWDSLDKPEWTPFGIIFNDRWLNATYSMKQIQEDIVTALNKIRCDLATLADLTAFSFEAIEEYKRTLDINRAIAEGKRLADIQKRKEEAERQAAAEREKIVIKNPDEMREITIEQPQEVGSWINFRVFLTVSQAAELKDFFNRRGIEFRRLP